MSDKSNKDSKDKPDPKPTKRRVNPKRLSDTIIEGLQMATELQGFRYPNPPTPSTQSISMSVIHNGHEIITRSFQQGQNRRFDEALLDCDTEARAREEADNGLPAPGANVDPGNVNARPSGMLSSWNNAPGHLAQRATSFGLSGFPVTRTMSRADPYFDVMASSMMMPAPNPPEFPHDQYSDFMQLQFGGANPAARTNVPDPINGLMEGQSSVMNGQISQVTWPVEEHPQHSYEYAHLSRLWLNQEMRGLPRNATQTNWEAVVSSHSPSRSSRRSEQQSQQVYARSQADVGFFAHDAPSNGSSQTHYDIDIHVNSPSAGYTIETGTHTPYHMASGSSSTIAPSQSQPYYYQPPSDVPAQAHHHSSWFSTETWPPSTYDSSPRSYSSSATTQLQAYRPTLGHASYPNALILTPNNDTTYDPGPASMGGTPFSTVRVSLSPNNAIGHTEMGYQNPLTRSPLLGFSNVPNIIGSSAPLLPFPIVMSPDNIPSDINFNDLHAGNSSLSRGQRNQ